MDSRSVVAIAFAVLLVVAAIGGAAGSVAAAGTAAASDPDTGDDARDVGPLTACFHGDGYPLSIGDGPATIDALLHVSVVTDRETGNEFGVELAGTLDDDPIVTLAAGVRLTGREAIATGNPFAAFDLLYTYEFRLPMFEGHVDETTYEDDGAPVDSAAGVAPC